MAATSSPFRLPPAWSMPSAILKWTVSRGVDFSKKNCLAVRGSLLHPFQIVTNRVSLLHAEDGSYLKKVPWSFRCKIRCKGSEVFCIQVRSQTHDRSHVIVMWLTPFSPAGEMGVRGQLPVPQVWRWTHPLQGAHEETTNMSGPSEVDRFREACRSKDALFARLDALVDAVETAKDGEEQKTALNAFSQQKVGIARRLSELVDSLKVVQEITRPLEEAGVAPCRKMHTVLVAGAALGVPAPPSCPDELTGRANAVREASLAPSSTEEFRVPHTFRKSRRATSLTFSPSDDAAVARALLKQRSLPVLERTQGVASSREDTPTRSLARWGRHNLAKRIAKGLRLPRLPFFGLAYSTALDTFFGGVDFYPAYNRF